MKRLLSLLICITVSVCAQAEESSPEKNFFVPWKPLNRGMHRDKRELDRKDGAVVSVNEFLALEGNLFDQEYQNIYRYSPADDAGYNETDYAMNFVGVGKIPINDFFTFFAKAGPAYYQSYEADLDPLYIANNPDEWGLTYSTGARLMLSPNLQLSIEYMQTETEIVETEAGIAQLTWGF